MLMFIILPLYFVALIFFHAGSAKVAAFVIRRITLPWNKAVMLGLICAFIQFSGFILAASTLVSVVASMALLPVGAAWFLSSQTLTRSGEPVTFGLGLVHSLLALLVSGVVLLAVALAFSPSPFEGGG